MQHYFKILLCFDDDDDIALLDITDAVYNWLVNFFSERRHCTRYRLHISDARHLGQYYSRVRNRSSVLRNKHW